MVPGVTEQTTEEEPTWCPKQTKPHAATIQQKHMRQRNKGSACCQEANKESACGDETKKTPAATKRTQNGKKKVTRSNTREASIKKRAAGSKQQ